MKKLILAGIMFVGVVASAQQGSFSKEIQLPGDTSNVQLVDAEYFLKATETRRVVKPGCEPNNEISETCEYDEVVASEEVVRVNVAYENSFTGGDESGSKLYASATFPVSAFSKEEIDWLKASYPTWKHPFSNTNRKFAKKHFEMNVSKEKRSIQVADPSKSRFCTPNNETGEVDPRCEEEIVYKESWTWAVVVRLTVK